MAEIKEIPQFNIENQFENYLKKCGYGKKDPGFKQEDLPIDLLIITKTSFFSGWAQLLHLIRSEIFQKDNILIHSQLESLTKQIADFTEGEVPRLYAIKDINDTKKANAK